MAVLGMLDRPSSRIWIDVEDFFEYGRHAGRPSGIQRLAFEIYRDLHTRFGTTGQIIFFVHEGKHIVPVDYQKIAKLFERLTHEPRKAPPREGSVLATATLADHSQPWHRKLYRRLPYRLRPLIKDAILAQLHAFHAWGRLIQNIIRGLVIRVAPGRLRETQGAPPLGSVEQTHPSTAAVDEGLAASGPGGRSLAGGMQPGDFIFILGSPWSHENYAAFIKAQKAQYGVRVAILIYDLIPIRRPEWCDAGLVKLFSNWVHAVLPHCDQVFAISQYSARDFDAYSRQMGWSHLPPTIPIPIGTGFGEAAEHNVGGAIPLRSPRLPPGDYALIVSTIEARKNHLLLFRVWRRLLEELPADKVPTLVFAGRVGWLVADLMQQLKNASYLNGKVVVLEGPSDEELEGLYQGCLFTLFPSFFEGWGLPVTESLAAGKPCLISNRTSLPEAGGGFARTFDPDDLNDAYRVIKAAILDRRDLARWEDEIRQGFTPISWSRTSDALLRGISHPLASTPSS